MAEQSFESHAKWVPPFHFFVLPVLLINLGFSIYWCYKSWFTVSGVVSVLVAAAIFVGIGIARGTALKVQDRVIRLEERSAVRTCATGGYAARGSGSLRSTSLWRCVLRAMRNCLSLLGKCLRKILLSGRRSRN